MIRRILPDLAAVVALFVFPLLMFWPQTLGGKTLLPTENLYQFEPYATYREVVNAPELPHNALVSDSVLQNLQWKAFIRQSIADGEVPLWNPHQFAGIPFMAAGQPSTLYPLNVIYYWLPLTVAYGGFVVVNLWLAGVGMYGFARVLGRSRAGAMIAAVSYQLCGFFIAGAVFPMMLAGAAWLPFLLWMMEYILRGRPLFGRPTYAVWIVFGAAALALNLYAGHVEITYYTILIAAYYGLFRLGQMAIARARHSITWRAIAGRLGALAAMGVLGLALGALQFVPLLELVNSNWRADGATFEETLSYAHPTRDVLLFLMPNFYGNPAQHSFMDPLDGTTRAIDFQNAYGRKTDSDWGIKNYVEGAVYVGILPLLLALFYLIPPLRVRPLPKSLPLRERDLASPPSEHDQPPFSHWGKGMGIGGNVQSSITGEAGLTPTDINGGWQGEGLNLGGERWLFGALALLSLSFMFGTPTYALLYYGLPGLDQSHTPFRWIYALTLCISVLAAFGWDRLSSGRGRRFAWAVTGIGLLSVAGILLSLPLYPSLAPYIERARSGLALADSAFPDGRAFYAHLFWNGLSFSGFTALAGIVMVWVSRRGMARHAPTGNGLPMIAPALLGIVLVAADLIFAYRGFNPSSDPALLDFTPPAITWLTQQEGDFRYITLDAPDQRPMLPANMTWRYGLDDVRGYESIISKQYVDYMRALAPQVQLSFNRIAPLYTSYPAGIDFDYREALTSPRLHLLNVRYVVTHPATDISDVDGYTLAYSDQALNIWENANVVPRVFASSDPICHSNVPEDDAFRVPNFIIPATVEFSTSREQIVSGFISDPANLIFLTTYAPGWRAYLQTSAPDGGLIETPLETYLALENFIGVELPTLGDYRVRLVYSPLSVQIGFFGSALAGLVAALMLGVWGWQRFIVARDADGRGLLARNSLAPVLLNLFNRGIDFVLAFVVLRVLGVTDAGVYYYAIVVFVWFDIFTNFGLDVLVMREVSRDRAAAGQMIVNTTAFRLLLAFVGIFLLAGFLAVRQSLVENPFPTQGIIALLLLYVGLIPASFSKGMTSLYYAFERAEYPAAVATVTSVSKAILQVAALLLGFGMIGLAAVSIFNNVLTLAILAYAGRDMIGRPALRVEVAKIRTMAFESFPLMLNHFLATIFFQIDVVILEALLGAAIVGKYSVGYRWLLALNIIPAYFTTALFPRLSQQAMTDRAALKRGYQLALKLLAFLVFPAAVLLTALAYPLTILLGGQAFMPEGALALQVIAWSMPIGWLNSLTQYVLIALNRQRALTWAFAAGVTFNITANLIFIPIYGYLTAAVTTILSEALLLAGFMWILRADVRGVNPLAVLLKPALAAAAMAACIWLGSGVNLALGALLGVIVYPLVWWGLRPLNGEERALIGRLLPQRSKAVIY